MYAPLVVAIQKSIINYIDLILIKVTKQSKEKTGLIKKKRWNSGLLLESRDRLVTRPQSADHGDAALLSAPGVLCVQGRWEGTHQKDARTRFFCDLPRVQEGPGILNSLKIVFLVWCKDCRLPSTLYISIFGSSSQPVGRDLFGRDRMTLSERSPKTSGKQRY